MSSEVRVKTEPDANDTIPPQKTFVRASNGQRSILKAAFQTNNNPPVKDFDEIAVQTGLEPKWIRSWFVRERASKKRAGKAKAIIAEDTARKDTAPDPGPAPEQEKLPDAVAPKKKRRRKKQSKKREEPPPAMTATPNELPASTIEHQDPALYHSSSPLSAAPSFAFSDLGLSSRHHVSDTSAITDYDMSSFAIHSDLPGSSPLPESPPDFSSPSLSLTRNLAPLERESSASYAFSNQDFSSSPPMPDATSFLPKLITPLDERMLEHYLKYASSTRTPGSSPGRSTPNRVSAEPARSSSPALIAALPLPRTYDEFFGNQRAQTEERAHRTIRSLSSPSAGTALDGIPIGEPLPLRIPPQIFDLEFAEREPFQAAMGLVALSKLGLKWD